MSDTERKRTPKPKTPRGIMPERPALERAKEFSEVAMGFTPELAIAEAERCLQCKKPLCIEGCPVGIDIPAFIDYVAEGDFIGGARQIKQDTNLPAICGRVCPQEKQCEEKCIVGRKHQPVSIGALERFVADFEREAGEVSTPDVGESTGKRVAVVGSGPAGLTVAGELARRGHAVTIYEALHEPGGVLVYGIPEFRLPKEIVRKEVEALTRLGVDIKVNVLIGRSLSVDDLFNEGADAVFIGTGAGLPYFLDIPGENLNGVYSANEFLTRVNLMKAYQFPNFHTPVFLGNRVAVFGGGNTAMDAARTSKRLGPESVKLMYRRSEAEMPARLEEVHHGKDEGIDFQTLVSPLEFIGSDEGWLTGVRIVRMELGEPDASGRRRPIPIEGSEEVIDIDTAIIAIGNGPNQLIPDTTPGLDTSKHGTIIADEASGATHRRGVFAGGDIVTGAATVIQAMGAGKAAASAIDEFLMERVDAEAQEQLQSRLGGFFATNGDERTDEERMAVLYSLGVPNPEELLNKPLPHWRARIDELLDPNSIDMMPIHVSHAYVRFVRGTIQALPAQAKSRLFRAKLESTGLIVPLRKLYKCATGMSLGDEFAVNAVDLLDDVRQSVRVTIYDGGRRFTFDSVRLNPEAEIVFGAAAEAAGVPHLHSVPFGAPDGSTIALVEVADGEDLATGEAMTDEYYRRSWPWLTELLAEQDALADFLGVADREGSYVVDPKRKTLIASNHLELFHHVPEAERMDEPAIAHVLAHALPDGGEDRIKVAADVVMRYENRYSTAWSRIVSRAREDGGLFAGAEAELTAYTEGRADEAMKSLEAVRRWNPLAHLTRLYEAHFGDLWQEIESTVWQRRKEQRNKAA